MLRVLMFVFLIGACSAFLINKDEAGRSIDRAVDKFNQKKVEIGEILDQKAQTVGEWFGNIFGFFKDKANFIFTTVTDGTKYALGVVSGALDTVKDKIQDKVDIIIGNDDTEMAMEEERKL